MEEQKETKKTGILWLGTEKCDLLYRVASIGAKEGWHVMVIDNSLSGDFFSAVAGADPGTDDVNRGNMTAIRNYLFEEGVYDAYEFVFYYQGLNVQAPAEGRFDMAVAQCTALGHEVCGTAKVLAGAPKAASNVLVYRDRASKKVSAAALKEELSFPDGEIITMDYDRNTMAQYAALTLDGDCGRLKEAGEDMAEAVAWFAGRLYGMNAKALKKYR